MLVDYEYIYNAAGLLKTESHHGYKVDYTYDKLGQLTDADYTTTDARLFTPPDERYRYDANGNRTSSYLAVSYLRGPNNQIASDGTHQYTYDADGNLRSRTEIATGAVAEFFYDFRGRLIRTDTRSVGGVILAETFVFDAKDRRIGVLANGTQRHIANNAAEVWVDFAPNGQDARRYLSGKRIDELMARWSTSGSSEFYLIDKLSTIRDIVGATSSSPRFYSAFGMQLASPGLPNSNFFDRFSFTGREVDLSGYYHFRAREYAPDLGVFAQLDPLGFVPTFLSLTQYSNNSPTNYRDPLGKSPFLDYAIVNSLIGGAVNAAINLALYQDPKQAVNSFVGGLLVSFLTSPVTFIIGGNASLEAMIASGLFGGVVSAVTEQILKDVKGQLPTWIKNDLLREIVLTILQSLYEA